MLKYKMHTIILRCFYVLQKEKRAREVTYPSIIITSLQSSPRKPPLLGSVTVLSISEPCRDASVCCSSSVVKDHSEQKKGRHLVISCIVRPLPAAVQSCNCTWSSVEHVLYRPPERTSENASYRFSEVWKLVSGRLSTRQHKARTP